MYEMTWEDDVPVLHEYQPRWRRVVGKLMAVFSW